MKAPSAIVHRRVRAALEPFLKYRDDWIFHYPVYLNTFCFTYDLAALLSGGAPQRKPDALGGNFRRHDWWRGLPEFTYRREIEIFVAVKGMIEDAKSEGHDIKSQHVVRFTRYDVKRVFVRKRPITASPAQKWLLVTDVPQAAQELVEAWKNKRPRWLRQFGNFRLSHHDSHPVRSPTYFPQLAPSQPWAGWSEQDSLGLVRIVDHYRRSTSWFSVERA